MKIYQNEALKRHMEEELCINPLWKERDFVSYARKYFSGALHKILAVGGLRGTGKTVGLLQSIKDLDACYITAQQGESEKSSDYIEAIKKTEKKCIIIDEYSWIKDREVLDKYLYTAVQNGKRIAITGTESITLDFLNYGNLIHRIDMVHVNLFSYQEYCRMNGKESGKETCREYLTTGGVFNEYAITNYENMRNYIKVAIIDNLVGYMNGRMSEERATALVYAVLFKAICPANLKSIPTLNKNKLTIENFLEEMGISTEISFSANDLRTVTDIMEQIELIVRVKNYDKSNENADQCYIVNPSLTCQLILAAYNIPALTNEILGHVFEASVLCHLHQNLLEGHKLYFLNTELEQGVSKELDAVIVTEKADYAYFIECKNRSADSLAKDATILDDRLDELFPDAVIDGRYVVFNGEASYRKLGDKEVIFAPMGKILDQYYLFDMHKGQLQNSK
ncbi:MAG: AAA family ATPase [Lachnospiraceae bacterium]|nr:AAA family ATPase [Lachnospiraceae bacterium]